MKGSENRYYSNPHGNIKNATNTCPPTAAPESTALGTAQDGSSRCSTEPISHWLQVGKVCALRERRVWIPEEKKKKNTVFLNKPSGARGFRKYFWPEISFAMGTSLFLPGNQHHLQAPQEPVMTFYRVCITPLLWNSLAKSSTRYCIQIGTALTFFLNLLMSLQHGMTLEWFNSYQRSYQHCSVRENETKFWPQRHLLK